MPKIKDRQIIAICGKRGCREKVFLDGPRFVCNDCGALFCSGKCLDEHKCTEVEWPDLVLPWEHQ